MNIHRRLHVLARAVYCESLERRMLLSLSPAGAEFRVNTFTGLSQSIPAIAADADGDFVVAWSGQGDGETGAGVFAQRYNAAGVAQGGEFRVNTFTTGSQGSAAVAMDSDGDFVVTWTSNGQDGSGLGVYAQRYNAAGVAQGGEFRVNTVTTGNQSEPYVAMDASGEFIVTWHGYTSVASSFDIYARRFSAAGVAQGGEFRVNTHTTNQQAFPSAAMNASGDCVIAWQSIAQDGAGGGVYVQRFNAAGAAQGAEFRVNTFTTSDQFLPSAAMDASGEFVVAWQSLSQDGSSYGVYAQRYNAAGVAQGGEFRANTFTTNQQRRIAAAMDADGDFLITWQSDENFGPSLGVFAQAYSAAGVAQGVEFRANTFSNGQQRDPAVAMNADGDAIVAWDSGTQDGSGYGIYAQRYDESNPDTAPPMVGGMFIGGEEIAPGQRVDTPVSSLTLSFSEDMSIAGGTAGANSATNRANYRLTRNGIDITSSQVSVVTFNFNATTRKYEAQLFFPAGSTLAGGSYVITARAALRDVAGNGLDGNYDGATGGDFTRAFSFVPVNPAGSEFRANATTLSNQRSAAVARQANGDFVVVWESEVQDGSFEGIYARRFSAAGVGLGAEFRVNSITTNRQRFPSVAMDADGDFVVTWQTTFTAGDTDAVVAKRYNSNGQAQGGEFRVNTFTTGVQDDPDVAMDAAGNFVITWVSDSQGLCAQRYNAAGVAQGGELQVPGGNAVTPSIAMDSNGDFVVAWKRLFSTENDQIFAQRYNAAGESQGGSFRVNLSSATTNNESIPDVAMDADGNFVVTWWDGFYTYFRRYNSAGTSQGVPVNVDSSFFADAPAVAMDSDGDFVVAYEFPYQPNGASIDIRIRRFNAAGVPEGNAVLVNTFTTDDQQRPALAMSADGTFVVAWESAGGDGDGFGIYGQRFARIPEASVSQFLFHTAPHRLQFTFNDNVSASLSTSDVLLENLTTQQTIPAGDLSVSYDTSTNIATFSYTGNAGGIAGVLPDGNYRATLIASGITNSGGTPMAADHVFTFFFLNGDANRDGRVNLIDFNVITANFGQSPRNYTQGDFNFDNRVNLIDYNILAGRFGQVLAAGAFATISIRGVGDGEELLRLLEELA